MWKILKQAYRKPLGLIRAIAPEILIALFLFVGGFMVGRIWPEPFGFLEETVDQLIDRFRDLGALAFIFRIFINNLVAAYLVSCVFVLFGIIPAFAAAANGLLVGWVLATTPELGLSEAVSGLAPHGIFEIPAVAIAWGIGIWRGVGHRISVRVAGSAWQRWRMANRIFVMVVVPLLLVAAVIEGRMHIARALFG